MIKSRYMEEFLHFLQGEMEVPGVISWFHLVMLIPIIALSIIIPLFFKDSSEKTYKRILLISWITLLVLETFKQILKAFHYGSPSYWEYSVRDFPFSICSMIYFFVPIILFVNKEKHPKIVDSAIGYMCLISLTVGMVVCIYTDMVMTRMIFINVQSLIHHGTQVAIGIYIFVWNRKDISIKTVYRTLIAFVITAAIAIIINVSFYPHFINMFFINPMFITNLPIGNIVQEKAGYPVFLIGFLLLIALLTYLTYLVETSIYKAILKKKSSQLSE